MAIATESLITNHDPLYDFASFVKKTGKNYIGRNGRFEEKPYIPYQELKGYWQRSRIRAIGFASKPIRPLDIPTIETKYLRLFSTLVYINKVDLFERITRKYESDDSFPLEDIPESFNAPIFIDTFNSILKHQWLFWPLILESNLSIRDLPTDRILPFLDEERISPDKRNGADIVKVRVHQSCNKLSQVGATSHDYVIIKRYKGNGRQSFENETSALGFLHQRPCPHIVKYHGSFIQNGHYCMILDLADGGNLKDFIKQTNPPQSKADIRQFWKSVFEILLGLHRLHHYLPDTDQTQMYRGVHQDIKPDNILLSKRDLFSPYDFVPMLADFGYSNVKLVPKDDEHEWSNDQVGNQMYGPPECSRHDKYLQNGYFQYYPSSDIFSVGCIFSEIAVWVARGRAGLKEYRNKRIEENKGLFSDGDHERCFHNGIKRLAAVDSTHKLVRETCAGSDGITIQVLDLVDKFMMKEVHTERATAHRIFEEFKKILFEADHERDSSGSTLSLPSPRGSWATSGSPTPLVLQPGAASPVTPPPIDGPEPNILSWQYETVPLTLAQTTAAEFASISIQGVASPPTKICPFPTSLPTTVQNNKVSINQLCQWRAARKSDRNTDTQVDKAIARLQRSLKGRDFIFFIDDSVTMKQHIDLLADIVCNLAYVAKSIVNDKLEYGFLSEPKNIRGSSYATPVRQAVGSHVFGTKPPLIEHCFSVFIDQLTHRLSHQFYFRSKFPRITVFVFTDGIWGDDHVGACGVENSIRQLMDKMKERHISRTRVAFQFIRFGQDIQGIMHLEYLVKLGKDHQWDIVDHQPANCDDIASLFIGSVGKDEDEKE